MRLIDADALMDQLTKKKPEAANKRYTEGFNDAILRMRSMVHSAPTVEHGEWEETGTIGGEIVKRALKELGIEKENER